MEISDPGWVGKSCGQHGPYTFFKTFKYKTDIKWKMLSLGDFFFVRCSENEPLCIAELQLLWETKNSEGVKLSSSRLYFLPECTPEGRMEWHGEDEVLAVRDKVVLKLEDLADWIVNDVEWSHGGPTIWRGDLDHKQIPDSKSFCTKVGKEEFDAEDKDRSQVIILSYNRYCRHKAMLKRLESTGQQWLMYPEVIAMGVVLVPHKGTKMLFCREEFEHPSLADNEQLCDHLAPKLKGRPRKKKSPTMELDENGQVKKTSKVVHMTRATVKKEKELQPLRRTRGKRTKLAFQRKKAESKEEAEFLEKLYKFMQERNTPIERLPCLGFKQINLFQFYQTTERFGGYETITSQRLWKKVYIELGGNPGCTSAATCTRRHYERYIQPYANHVNGDEMSKAIKLKKRKKTKPKGSEEEIMQDEKRSRPRKRVKKVREHLEELKKKREQGNGIHLASVADLSTVQPQSLPGHTVDANFNLETKGVFNSLSPLSVLHRSQILHPDDLRHKLNSKHQSRCKGGPIQQDDHKHLVEDLSMHNGDDKLKNIPGKSPSSLPTSMAAAVVSRPSVIQHTQQSHEVIPPAIPPAKADSKSYRQAVHPSDLILRNLSQDKPAKSSAAAADIQEMNKFSNKFGMPVVFPSGVPFFRPLVPYPMMRGSIPLMPFHSELPGQGTASASIRHPPPDKATNSKLKRAHQVPVIQPSSIVNSNPGTAEQDEPCDLSLPKKRKQVKEELQQTKSEIPANVVNSPRNGFSRTAATIQQHMIERNVDMPHRISSLRNSLHSTSSVPDEESIRREVHSPANRVKMTPQPRGSITQGIINSERPTSSRESKVKREKSRTPDVSGSPDLKSMYPFMYPGFMARGMPPFPFMPGLFRAGFPPMVQTPTGFFPQTPLLPPHSPLLASTVPTSLAMGQDTMLPRGVIVPSPLAFAPPIYRTSVPPAVVPDKQPAS